MKIEAAIRKVRNDFPLTGYVDLRDQTYKEVAQSVRRCLPSGGRILDFASGPCDKTAVLSLLGYECVACDDLSDPWHDGEGVRESILEFAESYGIRFIRAECVPESLAAASFDLVMAHGILEHLHMSPRGIILKLVELSVPNGLLYITVPNAGNLRKRLAVLMGRSNYPPFDEYYWSEGMWRGHVREYVYDDLKRLAAYAELQVVELRACDLMVHTVAPWLALPYRGIASLVPSVRSSWSLLARKPSSWDPEVCQTQGASGRTKPWWRAQRPRVGPGV